MMKFSSLALIFLFATYTASAQTVDEAEMKLKQQDVFEQALQVQVSDWFQEQGYHRSNLTHAMTVLSRFKDLSAGKVLDVINASIDSKQLQKSDWYQLVRFCQKAPHKKKLGTAESARTKNAKLLVNWCEENDILNQFIQRDAGNAYAYLLQMDYYADDRYTRANQRLLLKAAAAEYATDYFGYGLQSYTTHLREYYRTHQVDPVTPPVGYMFTDKPEDTFVLFYSIFIYKTYVASKNRIFDYCNLSPQKLQLGYDDKTVLACLRVMELFRSDNNSVEHNIVANTIIASLSPSGSDEQLEANRQKATYLLASQCVTTWGEREGKDSYVMGEFTLFFKRIPLLESMGELQARAEASDQYFVNLQKVDEPKPSSCLLLKDLSLENAEKLLAANK